MHWSIQDLAVYKVGGSLTPASDSLTLISSTIDVSPSWMWPGLLDRLAQNHSGVVLVTFRNLTAVSKALKRLDDNARTSHKIAIIDLSSSLYSADNPFRPRPLDQMLAQITTRLAALASGPHAVVLDGPDYLLASGLYQSRPLAAFVYQLQAHVNHLFIAVNNDTALCAQPDLVPIAREQRFLLTELMHQASVVLSLRPIDTGRAHDVTGVLRISQGPRISEPVAEQEYLYLVSRDNAKIFCR